METVRAMRHRLYNFLILGPEDSDQESSASTMQAIQSSIQSAVAEYESMLASYDNSIGIMQAKLSDVKSITTQLDEENILLKLRKSLEIVTEIRILEVAQSVQNLQNYSTVQEIPSLALSCIRHLSVINDGNHISSTEIYRYYSSVVEEVRARLLTAFLAFFEKQLNNSEEESLEGMDGVDVVEEGGWASFLHLARDWLLAYTLVSILPLASSSSSQSEIRVLDKYRDSLDELLVPLWGRYYFHLQLAQDSATSAQILWTFQYSLYFAKLLMNLCASMISSTGDHLRVIMDADYTLAANCHIIDKIIRFMRSHLAKILLACQTQAIASGDELAFSRIVVTLVEASLHFDVQTRTLETRNPSQILLTHVLLDSPVTLNIWLKADHSYFLDSISSPSFTDANYVYGFQYLEPNADSDDPDESAALSQGGNRCYRGVFHTLSLLVTAFERYQYLTPAAMDSFSFFVLEPLLLYGMALFLFRARSDVVLRSITEERRIDELMALVTSSGGANVVLPWQLSELDVSAHYYTTCLQSSLKGNALQIGKSGRLMQRWRALTPWIRSAAFAGLTPADLASRVFETFGGLSASFAGGNRGHNGGNSAITDEYVDYCILQISTLSKELRKQYETLIHSAIYRP